MPNEEQLFEANGAIGEPEGRVASWDPLAEALKSISW